MPDRHAVLSASKAHQGLYCPPSIRWSEKFVEPAQSEAAAEGTLAHALAEDFMRKTLEGKRLKVPVKISRNPLYKPAMIEHVQVYTDAICETLEKMRQDGGDPIIYLEQELDLSEWVPEGFGTADCVIIGNGTIHVFDFKYGKGVPVSAESNPQLMLYGLGALHEFGMLYDIDTVVLHIIQPRLESVTEWLIARHVLEAWGRDTVKPIAEMAFNGEGEYNPGEDQCRWCICKNACRAYNTYWQISDDGTRVLMISDAWAYANAIAKYNLFGGKMESWIMNAQYNDSVVTTIVFRAADKNQNNTIAGYGQGLAEALDNDDYDTYSTCLAGLENADAKQSDIRKALTDYFKPRYLAAFNNGDEDTMEEIQDKLLEADVGYKANSFKSWIPGEAEEDDEETEDLLRWLNQ